MKSHNQYSPSWDAHWLILKSPIFPLTKSLLRLSTIWAAGTCHGSMGTPGSSFSLWTNDDATSKNSQLIWSTFPSPAPAVSSQMEEDISLPTWTVSQMRQDTEKLDLGRLDDWFFLSINPRCSAASRRQMRAACYTPTNAKTARGWHLLCSLHRTNDLPRKQHRLPVRWHFILLAGLESGKRFHMMNWLQSSSF